VWKKRDNREESDNQRSVRLALQSKEEEGSRNVLYAPFYTQEDLVLLLEFPLR